MRWVVPGCPIDAEHHLPEPLKIYSRRHHFLMGHPDAHSCHHLRCEVRIDGVRHRLQQERLLVRVLNEEHRLCAALQHDQVFDLRPVDQIDFHS